jgi:flavodoxin
MFIKTSNQLLCLYSSVGGNTEMVIKFIADVLADEGLEMNLLRVDNLDVQELEKVLLDAQMLIFASPTYKQGSLEDQFTNFLKRASQFNPKLLEGKKVAIVGLGDNRYYPEYLTESASILESEIKKLGADLACPSLRVGMPPVKYLNSVVKKWAIKLGQIVITEISR